MSVRSRSRSRVVRPLRAQTDSQLRVYRHHIWNRCRTGCAIQASKDRASSAAHSAVTGDEARRAVSIPTPMP